jgi:putative SOS response-associated peptidase YedK
VCGRFTLKSSPQEVQREFGLDAPPELAPRFNIAPSQPVATIQADAAGRRLLVPRRWGLVPAWAGDQRIGARLINARAETLAVKPAFRDAFRLRRCLVPADGFYEWAGAAGGERQPYWIARPDEGCFGIAGLWERWRAADGSWLESCALVTTEANARLRPLHDRMPAILAREDYARWLDPAERDPRRLEPLLRPAPAAALGLRAVSRVVNRPAHDAPDCIAPLAAAAS